jgi:hypothetical protein
VILARVMFGRSGNGLDVATAALRRRLGVRVRTGGPTVAGPAIGARRTPSGGNWEPLRGLLPSTNRQARAARPTSLVEEERISSHFRKGPASTDVGRRERGISSPS